MRTRTPHHVLMFAPRFHDAVKSGEKRQTIRRRRARPIRVGDALSLRAWEGKARGSGLVVLAEGRCTEVVEIAIDRGPDERLPLVVAFPGAGVAISGPSLEHFARCDGFATAADMAAFWRSLRPRPFPFEGQLIRWEVVEP